MLLLEVQEEALNIITVIALKLAQPIKDMLVVHRDPVRGVRVRVVVAEPLLLVVVVRLRWVVEGAEEVLLVQFILVLLEVQVEEAEQIRALVEEQVILPQ